MKRCLFSRSVLGYCNTDDMLFLPEKQNKRIKKINKKGKKKPTKNLLVPYLSHFIFPRNNCEKNNMSALRSLIVIYVNIFHFFFCLLHLARIFSFVTSFLLYRVKEYICKLLLNELIFHFISFSASQ